MQTSDQALYDLYTQGEISYDEAINATDSKNEVRLIIKLDTHPRLLYCKQRNKLI